MRDLMFFAGFLFLVPLSLSNAFIALLIWGWTAVIAIDNYLFGFMADFRLNLVFALITIGMVVLRRDTVRGTWTGNGTIVLLALFLFQGTLSAILGYSDNPLNWELYDKFVKTLLFAFLMPLVVVGRYRIHAIVVMLCLGLGFHGFIDGLKFLSSGGGHIVRGFRKFGDNNHFAVILVMVIPLLLYISNYSSRRLSRWAALGGAFVTIAAVIGTRSRGGFVSLVAVGLWLIFTSRQRMKGVVLFVGGLVLILAIAPSSWMERMDTIKEADQDSSFVSRVEAWQVSSAIALSNPVVGGGFHSVQIQSVWERFRGKKGLLGFVDTGMPSQIFRAAHSIYFEVMGDMGFVGLVLFLGIMFNAIVNGNKLRRIADKDKANLQWATDLSRTLTAVIVAFLIGGLTVSLAYTEVIYVVVMLMEILRQEVIKADLRSSLAFDKARSQSGESVFRSSSP